MSDNEDVKAGLTAIFDSLLTNIGAENTKLYSSIKNNEFFQEAIAGVKVGNPEYFFYHLIHPINNLIEGLLNHEASADNKVHFLFMKSQFIETHFNHIIKEKEDWPCSADKSRTIMKRLARWLLTGERIEFDYNAEYTYHLPKTVFTTHEDIEEFFIAIF